ncbi:MAG: hypothetical protein AAB932_05670, partial [Patescibacteria group bacterium]
RKDAKEAEEKLNTEEEDIAKEMKPLHDRKEKIEEFSTLNESLKNVDTEEPALAAEEAQLIAVKANPMGHLDDETKKAMADADLEIDNLTVQIGEVEAQIPEIDTEIAGLDAQIVDREREVKQGFYIDKDGARVTLRPDQKKRMQERTDTLKQERAEKQAVKDSRDTLVKQKEHLEEKKRTGGIVSERIVAPAEKRLGEIAARRQKIVEDKEAFSQLTNEFRDEGKPIDETNVADEKERMERELQGRRDRMEKIQKGRETVAQTREDAKKADDADPDVQRRRQEIDKDVEKQKQKVGYMYGKAKAEEALADFEEKHQNEDLKDVVAQKEVWDKRGVPTARTAHDSTAEQIDRMSSQMTHPEYIFTAGQMFRKAYEERLANRGKTSGTTSGVLIGMGVKKALKQGWVDDTNTALWIDPVMGPLMKEKAGWTSDAYSADHNRDNLMMIASGGNVDFVRDNIITTEMLESAKKLGIVENSAAGGQQFFDMARGGKFTDTQQEQMRQDMIQRMTEEQRREFTPELAKRLDMVLSKDAGERDAFFNGRGEWGDENFEEGYLTVIKQKQGDMQRLANMRDDALRNGHPESSGYAITQPLDGEVLSMPVNISAAEAYHSGEFTKANVSDQIKAAVHYSFKRLTEDNGQVAFELHEDKFKIALGGVHTMQTHEKVAPRTRYIFAGLSGQKGSWEQARDAANGNRFDVGAMKNKKTGNDSYTVLEFRKEFKHLYESEKNPGGIKAGTLDEEIALSSQEANGKFAGTVEGNRDFFLMNMAEAGALDKLDAQLRGTTNFTLMRVDGTREHYTTLEQWVMDFNKGFFDMRNKGKKEGEFVPSERKLSVPDFTKGGGKGKGGKTGIDANSPYIQVDEAA